jgi:hypothetical protein
MMLKAVSGMMLTLLLTSMLTSAFNIQPVQAEVPTTTVTYDYYVVAGYEMEPTLPSPTLSPQGFNFTVEAFKRNATGLYFLGSEGCNFGSLTNDPGYPFYLKAGFEGMTLYGGVYARVNITNLLGFDIIITNLTAEVTAGTPTLEFWGPPGQYWGNHTLVWIDPLDTGRIDEVNYTTGEVHVVLDSTTDIDWWTKAVGTPYPTGYRTGVVSLVLPDPWGDAEATGHVAPIHLAAGETLTEYFGIIIFGDVERGTQIDGTITLSLTYEYEAPPEYPLLSARIDVDPDALNLKSKGRWITAYVELPEGYNVSDIDVYSIMLNNTFPVSLLPNPPVPVPTEIGDHDDDGIPDLMVKFNRTELTSYIYHDLGIKYGDVTLTISGNLTDGTPFEGSDTIRVIFVGDVNDDGVIDSTDLGAFGVAWSNDPYEPDCDFNSDGVVDSTDYGLLATNYGATVP